MFYGGYMFGRIKFKRLLSSISILGLGLSASLIGGALAQEVLLDTVIIQGQSTGEDGFVNSTASTGTKTDTPIEEIPQSISVINRERIDAQGFDSIADIFRFTPGVSGESFGNDSRDEFLRFRGFNDDGTGVFKDGLALRSTGFGQFLPEIYGVERVEVLKGPASGLFGIGSPGGLVNLVSKTPKEQRFIDVDVNGGSFEQVGGRFDINQPLNKSKTVLARLNGLFRVGNTQLEPIDDDRFYIAPSLTFKPNEKFKLTLLGAAQIDDTGSTNQFLPSAGTVAPNPNGSISSTTFLGEESIDEFQREAYSIGYKAEFEVNDQLKLNQNFKFNSLDVTSTTLFFGGLQPDLITLNRSPFLADAQTQGLTIDTNAQYDFKKNKIEATLLGGVDFLDYQFEQQTAFAFLGAPPIDVFAPVPTGPLALPPLASSPTVDQQQVGIYAQGQFSFDDRFILNLNGRFDFVDTISSTATTEVEQDDLEFSGRVGVAYKSKTGFTPYASYTRSFEPEFTADINGDLFDASTGDQFEVGVKYKPKNVNALVTVSAFNITQTNVLVPDPANIFFNIQVGEARSRGVEIEVNAELNKNWDVNFGYAFIDTAITESPNPAEIGTRLPQAPEHEISAFASYTFRKNTLKGLSVGLGGRYRSDTTSGFNAFTGTVQETVDGFFLLDGIVKYQRNNIRLSLEGENILNNEHIAGCSGTDACFFGANRRITGRLGIRF